MFCANDVVVKTGCFRKIAGIVFERFVFFVARPSVKAWARTPPLSLYVKLGRLPLSGIQNTWQRVPFICRYQQNIAGVEPPIFVEEIPAPFHKVRTYCRYKGLRLRGNMLDAVRWQNHGVLRSTCGPPWDHTFFPKIMTRWDENVTCSLRCIAYKYRK